MDIPGIILYNEEYLKRWGAKLLLYIFWDKV